ncbi:FtsX-like permease family protein [bacterium]|nr:FtsX-like permease family protein [bacterium]
MSPTLLRKVVRDLLGRKASLFALVLIMGFGIAALVGFLGVARDLEFAKERYFAQTRIGDFYAPVKRAPAWVTEELRELPNVREVRGRVRLPILVDLPDLTEPVTGTALSLPAVRQPVINDVLLRQGSWFSGTGAQEILLNDSFARENHLHPGHRLRIMLLDEQREFLVVGTVTSAEYIYLIPPAGGLAPDPKRFAAIYFEEKFLQEAGDLAGAYNEFLGTVYDKSDGAVLPMLRSAKEVLDQYGVVDAQRMNEQPSTKFLENELENVKKSSLITPVIFLSIAALILNVLVARLVQQQRVVIGTLKAIGYTSVQIMCHYLLYGVIIGAAGALLGSLLALLIQFGMLSLYRAIFEFPLIEQRYHFDLYITGLLVSSLAAAGGTLKGTLTALRLQPAEAMHPPPPERAHRTPIERFPALWTRLPFRWKMVFRAIFRNPFRSLVSVFSGLVATMLIIGAFAMRDGMKKLARYELEEVSHQDLAIALRDPKGPGLASEELQFVQQVEPQLNVPADFVNGARRRTVSITGIDAGNFLYTPLDQAGEPITIPASGLVLSRKLAELLDVGVGDQLIVQPLIGERRQTTATVVALVDTYVGLSAYARIDYLSRLIGEEWAANRILTRSFPGSSDAAYLGQLKEVRDVVGATRRAQALELFEETFSKANAVIIGIFIIFAMVIGFGSVLNSALVSLSERQREVATLRVLGFTTGQVARIFAIESLILYGLGTLLGLYAGVWYIRFLTVAYSSELFRFPMVLKAERFALTAFLMLSCILAAQVAVRALIEKLDWLEVMKVKE